MNEINRGVIVVFAALVIIIMAVLILLAWAADTEGIDRLQDFVQYLRDHADNPGKLILTLGALTLVVLAVLLIVVELAPEAEAEELRVEQAGATTIVPAQALRRRLEEGLLAIPGARAAKVQVGARNKGVGVSVDLAVAVDASLAVVSQAASRAVADTLQNELGLPLGAPPVIRITLAQGEAAPPVAAAEPMPAPESPPADSPAAEDQP